MQLFTNHSAQDSFQFVIANISFSSASLMSVLITPPTGFCLEIGDNFGIKKNVNPYFAFSNRLAGQFAV